MEKLRKVLIILLGLAMATGTVVSVAQAGDMAVKMAVAADMDGAGKGGCDGCAGGDGGDTMQCAPVCAIAGFALLPPVSTHALAPASELPLPVHLISRGRPSSPDPYPPKSRDFS